MGHGVVDRFMVIDCYLFHNLLGTVNVQWEPVWGSGCGEEASSCEECKDVVNDFGGLCGVSAAWCGPMAEIAWSLYDNPRFVLEEGGNLDSVLCCLEFECFPSWVGVHWVPLFVAVLPEEGFCGNLYDHWVINDPFGCL